MQTRITNCVVLGTYLLQENHGAKEVVTTTTGRYSTAFCIHASNHVNKIYMRVLFARLTVTECSLNLVFVLKEKLKHC